MSLKVIKTRLKGNNALEFATLIAQLAVDVSSLASFPPAAAAASAVLTILGTVQASEIQGRLCFFTHICISKGREVEPR